MRGRSARNALGQAFLVRADEAESRELAEMILEGAGPRIFGEQAAACARIVRCALAYTESGELPAQDPAACRPSTGYCPLCAAAPPPDGLFPEAS